ncbi:DUF1285 domain-containing protein [Luminiphilus sp.]|nr:DUF1285 domain-containing protein [Luminiphilus sp.]MDB2615752.1 DUF1285 domain-containing protein [Luminiphilus sp.]MDB3923425.1 DUF1285 domain-containing protein [Luminiphilus sp.]
MPRAENDALGQLAAAVSGAVAASDVRSPLAAPDWVTERQPPPVERWHPEHCGDIGMEIREDGSWWHDGSPIRRSELVQLFASILRLEEDQQYYLVTPVEKVIVSVALHPLRIIDAEPLAGHSPEVLILTLNTGGQIPLDRRHTLTPEPRAADAAYVTLDNGLTALFTRAAWYRLVNQADEKGSIMSDGRSLSLMPAD